MMTETKATKRSKAKRVPELPPIEMATVDIQRERDLWKSKLVPRAPKEGEVLLRIRRPQLAPATAGGMDRGFAVYSRGDILTGSRGAPSYVVVAAKPGFTARGSYGKRWLQLVVARQASDADHANAVQAQQPRWVEAQNNLHPMDR